MAESNSNVISISAASDFPQPEKVNTHLMNLFQEHIPSNVEHILEGLLSYLSKASSDGECNTKIMKYIELRNQLEQAQKIIKKRFIDACLDSYSDLDTLDESNSSTQFSSSLSLIENSDLDRDLAWQSAANHLCKNEHYKYLLNAEIRLQQVCPVKTENNPFGALTICKNFSGCLDEYELELNFLKEILNEFASLIEPSVHQLWKDTDDFLEQQGILIPEKTPEMTASSTLDDTTGSEIDNIDKGSTTSQTEVSHHSQPASPQSHNQKNSGLTQGIESASNSPENQLIEQLADKVINKVEGLLSSPESNNGMQATKEIKVVAAIDLASTLTSIQDDLSSQHACIYNITESIKSALENRGVAKKLSTRHSDLINVVGMLFEFILDDHDLPESIKKHLSLMQIPVLKLTLLDDTFLTDRHHPARELLNAMASAGMHLSVDPERADEVVSLIESTSRKVMKDFVENPDIFNDSFESFSQSIHHIYEGSSEDPEHDQNSLKEYDIFDCFTLVEELTEAYPVPESIHLLVEEAWPQILGAASVNDDEDNSQWFFAANTLEQLLWDLQPDKISSINKEDWLCLKNNILSLLDSIEYNPVVIVDWMQSLNQLTSSPEDLKPDNNNKNENNLSPLIETIEEQFEEIILETSLKKDDSKAPETEPDTTEVAEDMDSHSELSVEKNTTPSSEPKITTSHPEFEFNIAVGQWIDFVGKGDKRSRYKLSSIDEEQGRFIFVNSSGMKVAEMNTPELTSAIENGRIQLPDNEAFFDKALHKVMDRFLKF